MDFINIAALPVLLIDAIFPMQNIDYEKNLRVEKVVSFKVKLSLKLFSVECNRKTYNEVGFKSLTTGVT